jgi:hypothetical protein
MKRVVISLWVVGVLASRLFSEEQVSAEEASPPMNYAAYAAALQHYVNDDGLVNYKGLKAKSTDLDAFTTALAALEPTVYDRWSDKDKIAFWLNAYNAFTLQAIVTHYPIRPSLLGSLRFPKNSIRQIPGVWTELRFAVMGRQMTLDEIEHETLRKQFNEPRIHVALVCAAMGCPPLRNEPYTGDTLEAQLVDQTRRMLGHPLKFRIDRKAGQVYLSSIFKWFGDDFVKTYGANGKFAGHSDTEKAVLHFISQHLEDNDQSYIINSQYGLTYLDYDWSLNEQQALSLKPLVELLKAQG